MGVSLGVSSSSLWGSLEKKKEYEIDEKKKDQVE